MLPNAPHTTASRPSALVVMGVAGCGKSSVARSLADALGWQLHEGDEYHSAQSIHKMRSGLPLDDADRQTWLARLAQLLLEAGPAGVVLTCSALKLAYRQQLRRARPPGAVGFVFLDLDEATALLRVQARRGHFFPPALLRSQFSTLERPDAESKVLRVDATWPLAHIVQHTCEWLKKMNG